MTLAKMPMNATTRVTDTGIVISRLINSADSSEEPEIFLRVPIYEPEAPTNYDIGYPKYQFRLVPNYADQLTNPSHYAFLHGHKVKKIFAVPVRRDSNIAAVQAGTVTYINLNALVSQGSAFAVVPVLDPDPLAPLVEIATSVISTPAVGDNLGIQIFSRVTGVHIALAAPAITGAVLGFSAGQKATWRWTGFVARRDSVDSDLIHVLGGIEKMVARTHFGDMSQSTLYHFLVRDSTQMLIEPATEVGFDVPFTPSQLVEGAPITLVGGSTPSFWCIGRQDPEYFNPVAAPALQLSGLGPTSNTFGLSNGIAIWKTTDPTLKTGWALYRRLPTGVVHPQVHHLEQTSIEAHETSRDVGLAYNPIWQRLLPLTIDTDSGQDPVVERAHSQISRPGA